MKLRNIAVNNLRRRKTKAMFLIAGLMIGVASVVALYTSVRILEDDIAHKMDEYGANIVITPKAEELSLSYGGLNLGGVAFETREISQADLEKIKIIENAENIRTVSPKLFGVFENGEGKALISGVDFVSELALKPWWKITGAKPEISDDILVGRDAAEKFGLSPGSAIDIMGRPFNVAGVLDRTGSQDDHLFFLPLERLQALLGKEGKIAMAEVAALCGNCPISEIVKQISDKIPAARVTAIQQVVKGRMETLASLRKLTVGISVIVLMVGAMVVFVTMMASVNERTREIGIFSAIGFRRSHIMRIILLEALIVSAIAGILGYVSGFGGAQAMAPFFIGKTPHFAPDPFVAAGAFILAIVMGLAASLYPAASASKMDPSEALRTL